MSSRYNPPELNSFVPVPVKIGDKVVLLGVQVAQWEIPPELNAILLQEDLLRQQAEEKAKKEAEKTNGAAPAPTNGSPPAKNLSP